MQILILMLISKFPTQHCKVVIATTMIGFILTTNIPFSIKYYVVMDKKINTLLCLIKRNEYATQNGVY